jgi:hypothetical protein
VLAWCGLTNFGTAIMGRKTLFELYQQGEDAVRSFNEQFW